MLQDPKLLAAVSPIVQRSERQEDVHRLLGTYVDVGLLPQLNNSNHQVFYGRRGTGKTHVIRVLEAKLREQRSNSVVYIDCRVLGSTAQFSDDSLPLSKRCLSLFRDILLAIYHGLLEHIVEYPSPRGEEAMQEADALVKLITEPISLIRAEKLRTESSASNTAESSFSLGVGTSAKGPSANARVKDHLAASETTGRSTEYAVESSDKVIFPELQRSLRTVLSLAETRLYVLIDEWSSLPAAAQPYLAEFIKRGVLPISMATVKVSALEYRCHFNFRNQADVVGFELGADIATAPDLDDYFVFDRNPERITPNRWI